MLTLLASLALMFSGHGTATSNSNYGVLPSGNHGVLPSGNYGVLPSGAHSAK